MKTTKIRLLATMITLVAVTIIATIPVSAQRRSTGKQSTNSGVKKSDSSRKSTVQKKSTYKTNDKVQRTPRNSSVTKSRNIERKSSPKASRSKSNNTKRQVATRNSTSDKNRRVSTGVNRSEKRDGYKGKLNSGNSQNSSRNFQKSRENVYANKGKVNSNSGRVTNNSARERVYNSSTAVRKKREAVSRADNRSKYRLDTNDKRYRPAKNFRGSNKTWSNKYRPNKMNYNHNSHKFYNKYNYHKQKHWDRHWEHYSWNHNSWRDYYHGYHAYSYRFHKHYYHHNYYGHVIRRFSFRPDIFVHNHQRYYNYNGHFFRYHRGVGYVLVDMPFGLSFEYIPNNYESVNINGYFYLRVGNLFFEQTNYGYRLVHYPERYFAYDDSYDNDGYQFDDY